MTTWKIDPAHSEITFSVRHMMITNVTGRFENFTGEVDFNEENPEYSQVYVEIDTASINTREEQRDAHLRSGDFLNVEEYPLMVFESKKVEPKGKNRARLTGDLTIRDVTQEAVLDVEYSGLVRSPFGTEVAGFSATTTINRKDWGLVWNVALETGGVLVGEEITIKIELELVRQTEAEEELEAEAVGD